MDTSSNHWLPLTEYALRSGMSISTLRRKIKSNTIEFKMEEGRYLIRSDDLSEVTAPAGYASTDLPPQLRVPAARPVATSPAMAPSVNVAPSVEPKAAAALPTPAPVMSGPSGAEVALLREEFRRMQEDNLLRWKALEARVAGLVRKVEFFSEQMAEAKMLVKLFEEKLDRRA